MAFGMLMLSTKLLASFTRIQHPTNAACGSGTTCTVTVASTGANNLIVVSGIMASTSTTISSVSDGACTYVHPAGAHSSSTTAGQGTDHAYCLSSTAGRTSIVITWSASPGAAEASVIEYSFTNGPVSFDVVAVLSNQTATTTPKTASVTTTGTNDVVIGAVGTAATIASGSTVTGTGWTTPILDAPNGNGVDDAINIGPGATQATFTSTSGAACGSAVAFKEAGLIKTIDKQRKYEKLEETFYGIDKYPVELSL